MANTPLGYSRKAIVAMDHLSFVQICKKPLYFCPTCLQRVMIQMECYEIEVRFRVGKDLPVLDTITRKSVSDTCSSLSETLDVQINMVISSLSVSGKKLQEIKMQTAHE